MGILKHTGSYTWEDLDILRYKEDGNHFKDITRQILYPGCADLPVQFRYFEIGPGGHSTLERHHHVHAILVIRGSGEALVDGSIRSLKMFDVVEIPSGAWHQFCATSGEAFGIL
jgi:quercetin dioxygenase-like cupin family protein